MEVRERRTSQEEPRIRKRMVRRQTRGRVGEESAQGAGNVSAKTPRTEEKLRERVVRRLNECGAI